MAPSPDRRRIRVARACRENHRQRLQPHAGQPRTRRARESRPRRAGGNSFVRSRKGTKDFGQSSEYWAAVGGGIDDGNRPNMNGSKLAELVVPFPEKEAEQRRIVARVEALTSRSQQLRELNASLVEDMTRLLRAEYNRITNNAPTKQFS